MATKSEHHSTNGGNVFPITKLNAKMIKQGDNLSNYGTTLNPTNAGMIKSRWVTHALVNFVFIFSPPLTFFFVLVTCINVR